MFNHTSMFDGFLMAAIMPSALCRRCKSLMAAYTFKTPVLGEIFRLVGHEPVYFLKDDEGKFSVDKARQAPVNERIRAHVAGGGVLAFCPEGTVNRKDQTKFSAAPGCSSRSTRPFAHLGARPVGPAY